MGKHSTWLRAVTGVSTSQLYCSIESSSQAARSTLRWPSGSLRRRPASSCWIRSGSSEAGKDGQGGVIRAGHSVSRLTEWISWPLPEVLSCPTGGGG